jgi:phosphoglycerate dehydrogenase-like enzyme
VGLVVASQFDEEVNDRLRALGLGIDIITAPEDAPWSLAGEADVLLIRPAPVWFSNVPIPRPGNWPGRLKWVFSASAGIDWYPPWLLDAPILSCGRGVFSAEIADYVIAAIYLQTKNLEAVRARSLAEWNYAPLGHVAGSTVGIIGLGSIGMEVARRALALGTNVIATRRGARPSEIEGVSLVDDPAAVAAAADHIVIAVPLTAATHRLVDAHLLDQAKPGAHLINVARGGVVDQDALMAALDAGRLGFATLDVTDPEPLPDGHALWTHPRVRLTPHISTNYTTVLHLLFAKVANELARFARGDMPTDIVDPARGY